MTNSTEKPRLWVISELYYPEETSTGYYLTRIAEGMTDVFDVCAISGQPNYSARGTVAPKRERRNGVDIVRAAGTTLDKNVILFRIVNMLTLSAGVFFTAIRQFRSGDKALVVTNPPAMPFVVAVASLIKGVSYVLLIHDNYPEILVAAGRSRLNSPISRSMEYLNRWLYKYASRIIVVGRDMHELVARKVEGLDIPISTIPNWAELETVSPAERNQNQLLLDQGLSGKFVALYAGNMGPPNDLDSLIEAAKLLQYDPKFHFIFLGAGSKRQGLEDSVKQLGLKNVTVLGPRPRSDQQVFLNACDIAVVSLVDKMLGVSVPSRTYNILAAGKPILAIADERSEVARIVSEEDIGWTVPPESPQRIVEALIAAAGAGVELARMGVRARRAAETKYSLTKAMDSYRDALAPARTD